MYKRVIILEKKIPFTYGANKSTTLIPVTRISCSTDISTKGGASACIGAN